MDAEGILPVVAFVLFRLVGLVGLTKHRQEVLAFEVFPLEAMPGHEMVYYCSLAPVLDRRPVMLVVAYHPRTDMLLHPQEEHSV